MHHRQYQAVLRGLIADVITAVDLSQISHSPAHSDACIAALKEAGRRTLFGFSPGQGSATQYPQTSRA